MAELSQCDCGFIRDEVGDSKCQLSLTNLERGAARVLMLDARHSGGMLPSTGPILQACAGIVRDMPRIAAARAISTVAFGCR